MSRYTSLGKCGTILLCFLLVSSILQVALPGSIVSEIIEPNEEVLRNLVNYTRHIYQNSDSFGGCSCSKLGCDGDATFPDGVCDQPLDFGSIAFPSFGMSCMHNCTKRKVDMSQSAIWRSKKSASNHRLSQVEACWTQPLDKQLNITLHNNSNITKWQYIGTSNGLLRIFPGIPQNDSTCETTPYDPTIRPWYIAAISGRKNVIMVLDVSDSMKYNGRLDRLKTAVKSALNALNNIDYVGIVLFGSDARFVIETKEFSRLQLADQDNRTRLSSAVDKIETMGGTNFEAAFTKAYALLNNTLRDGDGLFCNTAILFVTDGVPTIGERNESNLLSLIRELDRSILKSPATIFTYVLGESTRTVLPRNIACATKGFFTHIPDADEFADSFTSMYAEFFSLLRESAQAVNPVWVEPYLDAFGLGLVTTVSQPVYDEHSSIIGVIGIDVSVANLRAAAEDNETAWKAIISDLAARAVCSKLSATSECSLNDLRKQLKVQLCEVSTEDSTCMDLEINSTSVPESYFSTLEPPGFCNETKEDAMQYFKFCCEGVLLEALNNSCSMDHCPSNTNCPAFPVFRFSTIFEQSSGFRTAFSSVLLLLNAMCALFTWEWIVYIM